MNTITTDAKRDATINGAEDINGNLVPLREGQLWKPVIELSTGKIRDWPEGTTAYIHYKVCDAGRYWLADANGKLIWKWLGDYVPDRLLCIGDNGYGDYIIMDVEADGHILGWVSPVLNSEEWRNVYEDNL